MNLRLIKIEIATQACIQFEGLHLSSHATPASKEMTTLHFTLKSTTAFEKISSISQKALSTNVLLYLSNLE